MHQVAEYGVAAHWAYKKGIKGKVDSQEQAVGMSWIKELNCKTRQTVMR